MAPLRPYAWLVNLFLAGAVSYAAATVSMQVLEQRLESSAPLVASAMPQRQEQREVRKLALEEFQPVLSANIFGAKRSEVKPAQPTAATGEAAPAVVRAPLQVTLTGTMIMGERSFALVTDAGGRKEQVYRLWDCLPGAEDHPTRKCSPSQGKLIAVRQKSILVNYQGERIKFELTDKPPPATAAASPRAARKTTPGGPPAALEGSGAPFPITQEGNVLEVRVPSGEVGQAFENFSDVLKQARVVPYSDDSGSGFLIRNIRPGSIFERIGLSNFDKIRAVNGEPITTADQALRLLTMFRNEREISLDLERKNEEIQLNYVIE